MVRAPTLVLLAVGLLAANSLSQEGNMNNEEKDNLMVSGILLDISLDDQKKVDLKPAGQPEHASLNQCQLIAQYWCSAQGFSVM